MVLTQRKDVEPELIGEDHLLEHVRDPYRRIEGASRRWIDHVVRERVDAEVQGGSPMAFRSLNQAPNDRGAGRRPTPRLNWLRELDLNQRPSD